MKKVLLLVAACLAWVNVNARQYDVFDMNGKHRGSIDGGLDKFALEEFAKKKSRFCIGEKKICQKNLCK